MDQTASAAGAARPRDANCFDFLRLFAATCVLVSHSTEHLKLPILWLQQGSTHSYWFYDGVALFFILSGFLVYHSYERSVQRGRPLRQYLLNRYLRIAPGLYAYALATTLLVLLVGAVRWSGLLQGRYWFWVASHIVLLPRPSHWFDAFAPEGINGSLWTIPVEFGFYLVIPLIYWVQHRLGHRAMLVLLTAAALGGITLTATLALSPATHRAEQLIRLTFIPYTIFFAIGIFWSKYWKTVPKSRVLALLCLAIYASIRTFNLVHIKHETGLALFPQHSVNPLYCLAWALPLSYAVLWIGHYGPSLLVAIPHKIGDLSYGVYIWHMVLVNTALYLHLSERWAHIPGGPQLFVVLGTFALAALSWTFVEKPALKLKPYSSRQAGTAPAGAEPVAAETERTLTEAPEEDAETARPGEATLHPQVETAS